MNEVQMVNPNSPVFANSYFDGTYDPTQRTVYRTGDILSNLLDDYTGEEVQFKKVEDPTGIIVDGVMFRELTTAENGSETFQRIIKDGIINATCYYDYEELMKKADNYYLSEWEARSSHRQGSSMGLALVYVRTRQST